MALAVARDEYGLWLGSGISRNRLPDLGSIVLRVLRHFQDHYRRGETDFRFAMLRALTLANIADPTSAGLDIDIDVDQWPLLPIIKGQLISRYAQFFEIRVGDRDLDYILKEVVQVADVYGREDIEPDCEHLCIAILILEGVFSQIASANWDGLVERALWLLATSRQRDLKVCVVDTDLRGQPASAMLYKFHGCAVRALNSPELYGESIVGRASQIENWKTTNRAMHHALAHLAATKPTLMLGLSLQDANVRNIFHDADTVMRWEWPSSPPAYVFAEDQLGADQETLLRAIYRDADSKGQLPEIEQHARFPAYAKQLLAALVLSTLSDKLANLIKLAPSRIGGSERTRLAEGVKHIRDRVASLGGTCSSEFIFRIAERSSNVLTLARSGKRRQADHFYEALSSGPVQSLEGDALTRYHNAAEFAVAVAAFGIGQSENIWDLGLPAANEPDAAFTVSGAGRCRARVLLASDGVAAATLFSEGTVDSADPDVVLVYCGDPTIVQSRSPRRRLGRAGKPRLREVRMKAILDIATTEDDLFLQFRQAVGI